MRATKVDASHPLTAMQQGMVLHSLSAPRSGVYVHQAVMTVRGGVAADSLQAAWRRVVDHHPVVRTTFAWDGTGEPRQVVLGAADSQLRQIDWTRLPEAEREARLEAWLAEDRREGFAPGAPPSRLALIRLEDALHRLVWTTHHALLDERSRARVLDDLEATYEAVRRGEEPRLAPVSDFGAWVERVRGQDLAAAEVYWKEALRGFRTPTLFPELAASAGAGGAGTGARSLALAAGTVEALRRLADREGLAAETLVGGAWALLLGFHCGEDDVVFGEARRLGPEEPAAVGLYLNVVPVRAEVAAEEPVLSWLRRLEQARAAAGPHVGAPLDRIQGWSEVPRGTPLFDTLLLPDDGGAAAGRELDSRIRTEYGLTLYGSPLGGGVLRIAYDDARFQGGAVDDLLGRLRTALEAIAADPRRPVRELPILTEAERRRILEAWHPEGPAPRSDARVHELVAAHAAKTPEAIALVFGDQRLSYGELNARANRLAHRLRRQGIGPDSLVGLCVERSLDMVVGVLGILKAGAAYVPVDPSYPRDRTAFMLSNAGVGAVVTQRDFRERLGGAGAETICLDEGDWSAWSAEDPVGGAGPEDLAYVIYTSGSTGEPKGVMVTHGNLTHYVHAIGPAVGVEASDRYLHTASIAFSSSVRQLLVPLARGATVVIASPAEIHDPLTLFETIRRQAVTVIDLVPSYWRSCIQALERLGAAERERLLENRLRLALSASEPLLTEVPRAWRRELGHGARLVNMFGQTETTGIVCTHPIAEADLERTGRVTPIGRPLPGTRIYLLDRHRRPVPVGVPGELYVGGPGVGRGYLNRPELSAERFLADPLEAGGRLYRTGDRARYRPDGTLEFLGRGDNQVKIRGHRVELEEVEAALLESPAVRECVVVASEAAGGERRIVAYLSAAHRPAPTVAELRGVLQRKLPDYMVPAAFVLLDALPRTPNGKIDRRRLPDPGAGLAESGAGYAPPRTPLEEILAGIWGEVLGVERVGIHDNFFELGGHSLMAIQVATRIRQLLHLELPLRDLFEAPTIPALAARVEALGGARDDQPALSRAPRDGRLPLSFAQQRLWLLGQLDPESAAYNLYAVMRLSGRLQVAALERALGEVVRRHESLRTVFPSVDGEPVQEIRPATAVPLPMEDLSGRPEAEREAEAQRRAIDEVRRPFDLGRGPLFRALLLRLGEDDHLLVLTMHHIVSDGWSRGILYQEVGTLYDAFVRGEASPLPEPPVQYADYARWQRAWLESGVLEGQREYWKRQLGGELPVLDLPAARPRPAVQTFNGATRTFRLPGSLAGAIRSLGMREGATLYMTLLAAFQALLGRYSGQHDILVGSPVAGRGRLETEGLIGFFVNTLVMRTDLSGDPSFRALLARVREAALGAYAHPDVPFEQLVDALHPVRDMSRSPLFQVMFVLQNTPVRPLELAGLRLAPVEIDPGASKFDLTLSMVAGAEGLAGTIEYNTDLFDASTIERMIGHYRTLLEAAVADPERPVAALPLLTEIERRQLLAEWNDTGVALPGGGTIHGLFEAQARRTPDAVAVVFEDEALTYAELERRANQLAHHLRGLGVGPDVPVALCVERSLEMIVGLLGILKAGGAYVPLDPAYPRERLALMLEDCGAGVLVTQRYLAVRLPRHGARTVCLDADAPAIAAEPADDPASGAAPENLAYVIYTSGSTGRPKGVMVEHRNVVNFFAGMDARIGGDPPGVWLAVTSISFDISVLELFWTLARGYRVVLQGDEDRGPAAGAAPGSDRELDFSLFYFASSEQAGEEEDKYRLLLEGARFADRNGFSAVWTPERHFHSFGGLYPNPAVAGAAIAAITERVKIRAGSVVLPLHSPIRVAEEWSVVDNLSKGRVGISVASGWHDRDFVFAPQNYAARKELMFREIETVRRLWRGEAVPFQGGSGKEVEVRIFPRPVQKELAIWITAAGTPETYRMAGERGYYLLTHLLGQSVEQLEEKIALYRDAWRRGGHGPGDGYVTLMMHTYIGTDLEAVRETVRGPFREYLRTSVDLIRGLAEGRGQDMRSSTFTAADMEALLDHAFDRYFGTSALMGTPESCLEMVDRLKAMGVDEVACLIDFGVEREAALAGLELLAELKDRSAPVSRPARRNSTLAELIRRHGVTHLQCTPSMATMLLLQPEARSALSGLRKLLLGGEALPGALAAELAELTRAEIVNMYGPTETTVWSSTHRVEPAGGPVPIGRPIANTEFYVLDRRMQPVPAGVAGELYIGGAGVVRGYLGRPELTAERFVPDPFGGESGARLYRTGDLVRWSEGGVVEFLGRIDHQVKIRGHRIELGEIEAALQGEGGVREAVVLAREDVPGDRRLVAYVVFHPGAAGSAAGLRQRLRELLPEYMVPSHIVVLADLPRTPNAKIDRKALPTPDQAAPAAAAAQVQPANELERAIAEIWCEVLNVPRVGVEDNFFDLGGHSLLTVKVHARIRGTLGHEVAITDLFRFPTIRALVAHLGGGGGDQGRIEKATERAGARRDAMMRRRQRLQN